MPHPLESITDLSDDELPAIIELPGDLRVVAEIMEPIIGDARRTVRAVLTMADEYHGGFVYFRGLDGLLRAARNRRIRAEYDQGGITGPQLARKYRLSDRHIWTILGGADS